MSVFENLGEEKAKRLYDKFLSEGMNEDDAFNEVYSVECNLDHEDELEKEIKLWTSKL